LNFSLVFASFLILLLILFLLSSWPVWQSFTDQELKILKFLRYSIHQGKIKAKNGSVQYLKDKYSVSSDSSLLIFMDSPAIVSSKWLLPITISINKYEKSLVYPAIDIVMPVSHRPEDETTYEIAKSDDMVASFTWDFLPKWENIHDNHRVKHTATSSPSSLEWISPSIPSIFAISWNYFHFLDHFDEILYDSSFYHQENIDLSLRSWLCEGIIIQATCSRVGMTYENYHNRKEDVLLGRGIVQTHIDQNIANLGLRYLSFSIPGLIHARFAATGETKESSNPFSSFVGTVYQEKKTRDLSYQQRYLYRIDTSLIKTNIDPVRTGPYQSFAHVTPVGSTSSSSSSLSFAAVCNDFQWFLEEIAPGLVDDAVAIMTSFLTLHEDKSGYRSSLLQKTFFPMISSFKKAYQEKYVNKLLPYIKSHSEEASMLKERETSLHSYSYLVLEKMTSFDFLNPSENKQLIAKHTFIEPIYIKKYNGMTLDELQDHISSDNRENLKW
jgi:hypothetical protein